MPYKASTSQKRSKRFLRGFLLSDGKLTHRTLKSRSEARYRGFRSGLSLYRR
uniref:Uncharacterized protein n=1 Tax=Siphoviridae sp. ctmpG14 TaxID=2825654 RepID=A0A8S5PAL6_9CAUD|nr:MAG TPA: hypothetical protein [Siphoviridae sp. ctmpG14]